MSSVQVLVYDGSSYPERPVGLAAGAARYIGPVRPATMLTNDEWINIDVTASVPPRPPPASGVPLVIFDSDLSSDYDDAADLAVLEGLAYLGECRLIGMAVSSTNGAAALMMDAVNTFYGQPDIPIGVKPDVGGNGAYPAQIAAEFPHDLRSSGDCPLAKDMYRKALAASPDKSVIIVTAGYLDNVAALMQSAPDAYSPLNGLDLVRAKVKLLACAGGGYPNGGEFNFTVSPASAQYVVNNWPSAATFSPDNVGRYYYTGGTLAQAPANTPTRRVYVDIQHNSIGYPSWTQVVIYQAIRGSSGLFALNDTGYNTVAANGTNRWVASPDPTGAQEQAYIIERARTPVTDALNALMTIHPAAVPAALNVPGAPSDLKATAAGGRIDLSWVRNSYNETGFVIDRQVNGVWTPVATVGAGVTGYAVTGGPTAKVGFRVKAVNAAGSSYAYAHVWVYSGWTESNLSIPGQGSPLYTYYQTCHLSWGKGGDYRPNHVTVNDDSAHGKDVTVNVLVAAQGSEGNMFVYFFYRDPSNWYRVNYSSTGCRFEKSVAGAVSQVGVGAAFDYRFDPQPYPDYGVGNGSPLAAWQITATAAGNLRLTVARVGNSPVTFLNATDTMSFTSGKLGLGGTAMTPVWENFNFATGWEPATMTTFLADSFTRANGAVGAAETGGVWSASGAPSTWAIASNQLTGQSNSGYEGLLTVDDGHSDGAVQATFVGGGSVGIVFRHTSAKDYWVLTFGADQYVRLSYCNNGYAKKADPGAVARVGDVFRVELTGPAILVKRNAQQIISISDSTRASATGYGLLTSGAGLSKFDDFTHTSLSGSTPPPPPPPPPATAAVRRFFNVGGVAVPVS